MKIWIFNHYGVGPNSSGITRHYDLAKELVLLGHQVTIFASSFNHQKREEEQTYNRKENFIHKNYEGVNFYWIKTSPYHKNDYRRVINILSYTYKANKLAFRIEENPDIVIGSLMHPLAAVLGYKVAKKKKAKFYFEERDLWPQSLIDLGKVSPKSLLVTILSKLETFLYKKADKIIVLFDKAPNYVRQKGIPDQKIIYLPNGVDLKRYYNNDFLKLPETHQKELEGLNEKFLLIYTGAHSLANYLEAMLEIADNVATTAPHIHFVLVGDGPEKRKIIEKTKEKKLENITFLPPLSKEYIPTILRYADAGIITMRNAEVYKWGISLNKMFDYMAASLPIIMLSSLKDTVVSQNELGIVSETIEDISKKIVQLSDNKAEVKKYSENSNRYGTNNHTWERLAKKLEKHFPNETKDETI